MVAEPEEFAAVIDSDGVTGVHACALNGYYDTLVQLVEEGGADPFVQTRSGIDALMMARRRGHRKILKYFEELQSDGGLRSVRSRNTTPTVPNTATVPTIPTILTSSPTLLDVASPASSTLTSTTHPTHPTHPTHLTAPRRPYPVYRLEEIKKMVEQRRLERERRAKAKAPPKRAMTTNIDMVSE